jgi:hypothetical protein
LRGHVFRITRNRIDRHLQTCVVCRSEFEALRRTEETRQILKYVDSPGGVAHRLKEGIFALTKLKKILYGPYGSQSSRSPPGLIIMPLPKT